MMCTLTFRTRCGSRQEELFPCLSADTMVRRIALKPGGPTIPTTRSSSSKSLMRADGVGRIWKGYSSGTGVFSNSQVRYRSLELNVKLRSRVCLAPRSRRLRPTSKSSLLSKQGYNSRARTSPLLPSFSIARFPEWQDANRQLGCRSMNRHDLSKEQCQKMQDALAPNRMPRLSSSGQEWCWEPGTCRSTY